VLLGAQVLCCTSTEYWPGGWGGGGSCDRPWVGFPSLAGNFPFTSVLLRTRCSTMMTISCYVLVFSDSDNKGLKYVEHHRACGERSGLRELSGIGQYVSTVACGRCVRG
jgi:hypothetical protein